MKIKRLLIFMLLLFSAFTLFSCQEKRNVQEPASSLLEREFIVGIKIDEFETKGKLFIGKDGTLHFVNTNPNSVLFGMEEVIDDEGITVKYKGIEWRSDEVDTALIKIRSAVEKIAENKPEHSETCETKGYHAKKAVFNVFGSKISYIYTEKDQIPLQIKGSVNGVNFEINFGVDRSDKAK